MAIAGFSIAETKAILEHIVGRTELTKPATTYVALLTSMPATNSVTGAQLEAGTNGAEVTTGAVSGYTRRPITGAEWDAAVEAAETGELKNTNAIEWTGLGGAATVVGWALMSASSGGTVIAAAKLEANAEIGAAHTPAKMEPKKLTLKLK